jgi:hypothetical protein
MYRIDAAVRMQRRGDGLLGRRIEDINRLAEIWVKRVCHTPFESAVPSIGATLRLIALEVSMF